MLTSHVISRPTVLVVDDTPDNLTLIGNLLQDKYTVKVATRGTRALRIATGEQPPDLILLDVMMPEMDGFEVMRQLQANPETQNIPVIFLTARTEAADEERGLVLGAVDYVTKPISPPILLSRVRNHLMLKTTRDQLQHYLDVERRKLKKLVDIAKDLSAEMDMDRLLEKILFGSKELAYADRATLYLRTEDDHLKFAYISNDDKLPAMQLPLYDPETGAEVHRFVSTHVALTGESVLLADVYGDVGPFDVSGTLGFDKASGYRTQSMLTVALKPREGKPLGVLQLLNPKHPETGEIVPFDPEWIGFVEALATQGAIALDNLNLIKAQERLFDAVIKVIASAIDAKSPYTGGHCERVPVLGKMLAEAACAADNGPFAQFAMSNVEWKEFHLAGWLHDCGKVTTPEVVVDKATKLECVYNRIHEVRMRYEVVWRDIMIADLEGRLAGRQPDPDALSRELAVLRDEFAFIAKCNVGSEFTSPGDVERLRQISQRQWLRYFDNRLGLSFMEELRLPKEEGAVSLPVRERLLEDRPEHLQTRPQTSLSYDPEKLGITLTIPEYLFHYGELYNLSIARGTLNTEERFKINEHVIHTLVMLRQLPFPKGMSGVPKIASNHHETMIGTGYPCGLRREDLDVQSRILAIADIFEALTAVDRPYKKAKSLSEALKIMSFMRNDQHIDRELFELFLRSGVYEQYARKYMKPEQIDAVNIEQLLKEPPPRVRG
ncbi:MAG: response regulator [Magnetococcales bacterium]|nr:response regulator [Magnetococcales bacterium]MBF0150960.1 response regulator [Magnetococcales bacterium]MBF0172246.1 response regulator [Magnetococcales bacterium]MBF0631535.1 response regulator [Magnetococcales bacterium]